MVEFERPIRLSIRAALKRAGKEMKFVVDGSNEVIGSELVIDGCMTAN